MSEPNPFTLEPAVPEPTGGSKNFYRFWLVYPKKVKRREAEKVWKLKRLDGMADKLIADVKMRMEEDDRWLRGFAPDPTTYLRGERWDDEVSQPKGVR